MASSVEYRQDTPLQIHPQAMLGLPKTDCEVRIEKIFEELRQNPPLLNIILKKMPKGGDLHIHMMGSVYSESLLELAIEHNLYFNEESNLFSKVKHSCNVPAAEIEKSSHLLEQFSNAISMRDARKSSELGHDHFMYDCFGTIGSIADCIDPRTFVDIVREQVKKESIQYLELMVGMSQLKAMAPHFSEMKLDELPKTRFIIEISRIQSDDEQFEQTIQEAFELIQANPEILSLNMVGPEDHPISQTHFERQIAIIDKIWQQYRSPMTLHAGELTQKLSSPKYLNSRIQKTLMFGHCSRIGHGVSISEEEDALELLKMMRINKIAVEVCLSSNAGILGVVGEMHPISLYLSQGVPVVLASDDPAVNRANLTEQFLRAVIIQKLGYHAIKTCVRNSIQHSFLPGKSIFKKNGEFKRKFREIGIHLDRPVSEEIQNYIKVSEKAAEQVNLEIQLAIFERDILRKVDQ
jgi:hypothetical protein